MNLREQSKQVDRDHANQISNNLINLRYKNRVADDDSQVSSPRRLLPPQPIQYKQLYPRQQVDDDVQSNVSHNIRGLYGRQQSSAQSHIDRIRGISSSGASRNEEVMRLKNELAM